MSNRRRRRERIEVDDREITDKDGQTVRVSLLPPNLEPEDEKALEQKIISEIISKNTSDIVSNVMNDSQYKSNSKRKRSMKTIRLMEIFSDFEPNPRDQKLRQRRKTRKRKLKMILAYFQLLMSIWIFSLYEGLESINKRKDINDVVIIGNCPQIKCMANLLSEYPGKKIEVVLRPRRKIEASVIEDSSGFILKNPITSNNPLPFPKPNEQELSQITEFTGIPLKSLKDAVDMIYKSKQVKMIETKKEKEIDDIDKILFASANEQIEKTETSTTPETIWNYPQMNKNVNMRVDSLDSIIDEDHGEYLTLEFNSGKVIKTERLIIIDEFLPDELNSSIGQTLLATAKVSCEELDVKYKLENKIQITPLETLSWRFLYEKDEEPLPLDDNRIILTGCKEITDIFPLNAKLVLLTPLLLPPTDYPLRNFIIFIYAYVLHYQ